LYGESPCRLLPTSKPTSPRRIATIREYHLYLENKFSVGMKYMAGAGAITYHGPYIRSIHSNLKLEFLLDSYCIITDYLHLAVWKEH
jgi:hypothetical protein